MDLTTRARVKVLLQGAAGTTQDSLLDQLITAESAKVEKYLDRGIEYLARTEFFNVAPGQSVFRLGAWPGIDTTPANFVVYNDVAHASASYTQFPSTTEIDEANYAIDAERGLLLFHYQLPQPGPKTLKVTYSGGMHSTLTGASKVTNFVAQFPDLAYATELQVVAGFNSAKQPSASGFTDAAGSVTYQTLDLLPQVKRTLDRYRRFSVG